MYLPSESLKGAFFILQQEVLNAPICHQKDGAGALESHHERTKEKYATNPDVDTSQSK